MTSNTTITVVQVILSHKDGYYFATSEDVPGLHLCSQDRAKLESYIIPAIKLLFKDNRGLDVEVLRYSDPKSFPEPASPSITGGHTARYALAA